MFCLILLLQIRLVRDVGVVFAVQSSFDGHAFDSGKSLRASSCAVLARSRFPGYVMRIYFFFDSLDVIVLLVSCVLDRLCEDGSASLETIRRIVQSLAHRKAFVDEALTQLPHLVSLLADCSRKQLPAPSTLFTADVASAEYAFVVRMVQQFERIAKELFSDDVSQSPMSGDGSEFVDALGGASAYQFLGWLSRFSIDSALAVQFVVISLPLL